MTEEKVSKRQERREKAQQKERANRLRTMALIVVGVAMDTVNQIEAQLIMRHYEGFTPRAGRIRGRRSFA